MTRLTPVFLVLLRLAIGWHFLFEGLDKINNPTWSSAGYLREASGPLAAEFNDLAGDPVLLYCDLAPLAPGTNPSQVSPNQQMPPTLTKEWDNWYDRFVKEYDLQGEDLERIKRKYEQRKSQTGSWLKGEGKDASKKITTTKFGVSSDKDMTVPQRLAEYKKARKDLATLEVQERASFITGANARLPEVKADVARQRSALLADVSAQTIDMKKTLRYELPFQKKAKHFVDALKAQLETRKVPPEEQAKQIDEMEKRIRGEPSELSAERIKQKLADPEFAKTLPPVEKKEEREEALAREQANIQKQIAEDVRPLVAEFVEEESPTTQAGLAAVPVANEATLKNFLPEPTSPLSRDPSWLKWDRRQWADFLVRYGITAVGLCLILGLFTRTSCVAGAVFLTLFYLAMMPLPWLPESPKAEGHYLYINKNIIEGLALLALATTSSGRWVGLDRLVSYFSPFRRSKGPKKTSKKSRGAAKVEALAPTTNGAGAHEHTEPAEITSTLKPTHPEG